MKILDKYLSLPHFCISFFVGMFMVYITFPTPDIIFKYPTPFNSGKVIYKDSADTCYIYDATEVSCPKTGVIQTPLQLTNNKNKNGKGALTNLLDKFNGLRT